MLLYDLVDASARVAETSKRLEKMRILAECLRRVEPAEAAVCAAFLCGQIRQAKLGVGPQALRALRVEPHAEPVLSLLDVDRALDDVARVSGKGSKSEKERLLTVLFSRATVDEQGFLFRLLHGELRQGAQEGVLLEAVARGLELPQALVRRAVLLAGETQSVVEAALSGGAERLAAMRLALLSPLSPMLAQPAQDATEALLKFSAAFAEPKLDGARIQVHKQGDVVRVFSRNQNDVSAAVPEIVEGMLGLDVRDVILDGETIALDASGQPLPFQTTMRRFGRRLDVDALRRELPLSWFFFDCLHLDGEDLIERSYLERTRALDRAAPPNRRLERVRVASDGEVDAYFERALAMGYEGVMLKDAEAPYEAGRRGSAWLKLKPAHTLDLVVLAAEWGSGRRTGTLSNLHLGARDPSTGGFVMLGKTFKGLTDELLRFQTEALLARESSRDAYTVYVRPELVVEVAFDGLQTSPHYPGGLALRFARVKRYRPDKDPSSADTIDTVRALHLSGHRFRPRA